MYLWHVVLQVRDKPRIAGRAHELIAAGEVPLEDLAAVLGELSQKLQDGNPMRPAKIGRYIKLDAQWQAGRGALP